MCLRDARPAVLVLRGMEGGAMGNLRAMHALHVCMGERPLGALAQALCDGQGASNSDGDALADVRQNRQSRSALTPALESPTGIFRTSWALSWSPFLALRARRGATATLAPSRLHDQIAQQREFALAGRGLTPGEADDALRLGVSEAHETDIGALCFQLEAEFGEQREPEVVRDHLYNGREA